MNKSLITILKVGYSMVENGKYKADCTITLAESEGKLILVDTGGPWNKTFLKNEIVSRKIDVVVCTHGHSDHIGNLNLFPTATLVVSNDICIGDNYVESGLKEGKPYPLTSSVDVISTPGHTGSDVSVVVRDTCDGTVVIAGDLFECEEDLSDPSIWRANSENPELQEKNRAKVLSLADCIIPGHGNIFKIPDSYKQLV